MNLLNADQESNDSGARGHYKASQKQMKILLNQVIEIGSADLCLQSILALNQAEHEFMQNQLSKQATAVTVRPTVQVTTKAALNSSQRAARAFALMDIKPKAWVEIISLRSQVVNILSDTYHNLALINIKNFPFIPKPTYEGLNNQERIIYKNALSRKNTSLTAYNNWQNDTSILDYHARSLEAQDKVKSDIELVIKSENSELCLKCSQVFSQLERNDVLLKLADPNSSVSATLDASTKMGATMAADAMVGLQYMV